jgi:hypothetical protein
VTNTGTAPLVVRGSTVEDSARPDVFQVVGDTCAGHAVAPGGTCEVGVRFTPPAAGASYRAALALRANTTPERTDVPLAGTGVTAAAAWPNDGPASVAGLAS